MVTPAAWGSRPPCCASGKVQATCRQIDEHTRVSALSTKLSGQGEKFPELSTILKRLHSRRSPCRRSDFRRSDRGSLLVSRSLRPVIGSSSHCVDDDFLLLTRIRSGVNTGHTRCVERPSIIEAGRNLIDNVLDFHEDFITNGNC